MHDTRLKITFLPFCYHFPLSFVHIQAPSKDGIDNSDLYAMARVYGAFHGECGHGYYGVSFQIFRFVLSLSWSCFAWE